MHICMVMTVLAPIGGIESSLVPLARQLVADGHRVTAYIIEKPAEPNQNLSALAASGVRIVTPPGWLVRLVEWARRHRHNLVTLPSVVATVILWPLAIADSILRRRNPARSFRGLYGKVSGAVGARVNPEQFYYAPARRILRRAPVDVVHVHGWGCGDDPPGAIAAFRRMGLPVVYTEHNSPDAGREPPRSDAPIAQADVLIAVSEAGKRGLEVVGQSGRPIVVIPYSVSPLPEDETRFADDGRPVITCIARLSPQKGHVDLLRATRLVADVLPDVQLLLAGDGPLRGELADCAAELGLAENVRFLGNVPRLRLSALLRQTDVVALASYWEGLPVTLIEAISAGKACVVTDAGGNRELISDGVNGFVVPQRNPQQLAAALLEVIQNPERRRQMELASLRRFNTGEFSIDRVAAQTRAAYSMALAMHPAGRAG